MSHRPLTLPEAISIFQQWASENGIVLTGITLEQANGKPICLAITPCPNNKPRSRISKKMLKTIFNILPEHSQEPITFQAIKNRCGYKNKSHIYACLRRLEEIGKLEHVGSKYRQSPKNK